MFIASTHAPGAIFRFLLIVALLVRAPPLARSGEYESLSGSGDECTGYIVAGAAGGGQCYFAKNRDSTAWREGVALVTPQDGHKYLAIQTDDHVQRHGYGLSALSGLNDRGVGGATFAGFTSEERPSEPWDPSAACCYALHHGGSAEEYVVRFSEIVQRYGMPAGGSSAAVSPREAWKIEYAAYQWATEGPYVHDYSPIANVYSITSMKQYEAADESRFGRLRKARELLERGIYPNAPGKTWSRTWDLAKAFEFSRNTEAIDCLLCGAHGKFGEGALPGSVAGGSDPRPICDSLPWGRAGRCVSAHIVVPDKAHPDFLSVLWWSLDRPTNAPFIPLYIGISQVPKAIAADGQFEASDTFHRLRYLLHENPEYMPLANEVWAKFEIRQHRRIADEVEDATRALLKQKKEDEARQLLNEFVRAQVNEAMDLAQKLIHKIETESAARLLPN